MKEKLQNTEPSLETVGKKGAFCKFYEVLETMAVLLGEGEENKLVNIRNNN